MKVVWLDQNAWVDLACGAVNPKKYTSKALALEILINRKETGSCVFPLNLNNIFETLKTDNINRRTNLARVQCELSDGKIFIQYQNIVVRQIAYYLSKIYSVNYELPSKLWFIADSLPEAAAIDGKELEIPAAVSEKFANDPKKALFDFLTKSNETKRKDVTRLVQFRADRFIEAREAMRADIKQSVSTIMNRYSTRTIKDEFDLTIHAFSLLNIGVDKSWRDDPVKSEELLSAVPAWNIERRLVPRLEIQDRPITDHDQGDMASFVIALCCADFICGEKHFISLAQQARLDRQYNSVLVRNVEKLSDELGSLPNEENSRTFR